MRGRSIQLVVLTTIMGLTGTRVSAEALYAVTDLGQVDTSPNSSFNYLNALSATDQATFQSGSFERDSHSVPLGLPRQWVQGDVARWSSGLGVVYDSVIFASGNNQGDVVGNTAETVPLVSQPHSLLALFRPDPHTVHPVDSPSQPGGVPSPGYLVVPQWNGPVNSFYGTVTAINDHKLITGSIQRYSNWQETAPVLIDASTGSVSPVELGGLGGKHGVGNALNNAGQVVGWSEIADGTHHAFLYDKGIMEDLNTLIPPTSGLNLDTAVGIDASGRIVALGTDDSGVTHEYLLAPATVPEPSTLALFGLVAGGLVVRYQLRRGRSACAV